MTTKYEAVKIWVDKKAWNKLKIKLLKKGKGQSLSSWIREKIRQELSQKQ
jgi:hypothetical protein